MARAAARLPAASDLVPLAARAGFDACIAVQARQTLEETRWLLELADAHPFVRGVVGWVDLRGRTTRRAARALRAAPAARRRPPHRAGRAGRRVPAAAGLPARDRGPRGARPHLRHPGLPAPSPGRGRVRARAFRAQRFVLDHLGKPDIAARRRSPPGSRDLRRAGGAPERAGQAVGPRDRGRLGALDAGDSSARTSTSRSTRFGPARLMIGSDWPVCTLAGDYGRVDGRGHGLPRRAARRRAGGACSAATRHASGTSTTKEHETMSRTRAAIRLAALAAAGRGRRGGSARRRRRRRPHAGRSSPSPSSPRARRTCSGRASTPARTRPARELGVDDHLARPAARGRPRRADLRGRGLRQPRRLRHRAGAARRDGAGAGRSPSAMGAEDPGRDLRLRPQGRRLRQLRRHRQPEGRAAGRRAPGARSWAARARSCCCATPRAPTAPASARRASSRR